MGHRATCQSAMTCAGAPLHPMSIPGGDRAGCLATAGDIARLAAAEMEGAPQSVLLPSAVDAMHQPAVAVGGLFGFAADGYGLGHFTEELSDGRRAVWHGGQGYGWMSHMHLVPETGDGLIVLTNSQRWSWIFDQFYAAQRSDFGFMSRSKPQSWFLSSIGFGWGQQAMG